MTTEPSRKRESQTLSALVILNELRKIHKNHCVVSTSTLTPRAVKCALIEGIRRAMSS